jgi:Amt family ammonium transporter
VFGIIGIPNLGVFTDFANFDYANFVFNLVFCGTAATIVAGAMAERTKFSAYCIYSVVLSAIIYPIEAGWVWNENGWLAQMGFIDFAGSCAIHMVGGICGFVGAFFLGPRIGKYIVDSKTGKKVARAIPGHSMPLGALGCFILWFGWYGFNGAAAENVKQLGAIFMNTTLAPAGGLVATMFFTWFKNGKPDVSMAINGALSGLVAITAGCANVDACGAIVIGLVAGILVVLAVEFIDFKLYVDDPVGAVAVHGVNGIWGILAVGLFAAPVIGGEGKLTEELGLFYGGGAGLLGVQALGMVAIFAWTSITVSILFFVVNKFRGLRASREDELIGLDYSEHGLIRNYSDFIPATSDDMQSLNVPKAEISATAVAPAAAVPVTNASTGKKLTKVTIIANQTRFDALKNALDGLGISGITVTKVLGYGLQRGLQTYRGVPVESQLLPKIQIDIVVSKVPVNVLIETARNVLYTGNFGDGKIFVYDVENVVKVRTGEEGYDALQDNTGK